MDGPRPAHHLMTDELVWFDFDPAWLVALAERHADDVPAGLADELAACRRAAWQCDTYLMLREAGSVPGGDSLMLEDADGEIFVVDVGSDGGPHGVEFYDRLPCQSDEGEVSSTWGWAVSAMGRHLVGGAVSALRRLARPRDRHRPRLSAPEGELTPFERKVLAMMLVPSDPAMDRLRAQLDGVLVTSRRFTGAGFYTDLAVADDAPPAPIGGTVTLTDLHAYRDGEPLLGFVLWVKDGRLDCLECFDYVAWPEDFETLDLVAEHAAGGAPTDLVQLEAERGTRPLSIGDAAAAGRLRMPRWRPTFIA